jgi:hypothetical protein
MKLSSGSDLHRRQPRKLVGLVKSVFHVQCPEIVYQSAGWTGTLAGKAHRVHAWKTLHQWVTITLARFTAARWTPVGACRQNSSLFYFDHLSHLGKQSRTCIAFTKTT